MTLLADTTVKSALDDRHDLFIAISGQRSTTIVYLYSSVALYHSLYLTGLNRIVKLNRRLKKIMDIHRCSLFMTNSVIYFANISQPNLYHNAIAWLSIFLIVWSRKTIIMGL